MELQQNSSARLSDQKEKLVAPYCLAWTRKRLAVYLVRTLQRTIGIVQLHHGIGPSQEGHGHEDHLRVVSRNREEVIPERYYQARQPANDGGQSMEASPARASCKVK